MVEAGDTVTFAGIYEGGLWDRLMRALGLRRTPRKLREFVVVVAECPTCGVHPGHAFGCPAAPQ